MLNRNINHTSNIFVWRPIYILLLFFPNQFWFDNFLNSTSKNYICVWRLTKKMVSYTVMLNSHGTQSFTHIMFILMYNVLLIIWYKDIIKYLIQKYQYIFDVSFFICYKIIQSVFSHGQLYVAKESHRKMVWRF
jgi:hypothetical protein